MIVLLGGYEDLYVCLINCRIVVCYYDLLLLELWRYYSVCFMNFYIIIVLSLLVYDMLSHWKLMILDTMRKLEITSSVFACSWYLAVSYITSAFKGSYYEALWQASVDRENILHSFLAREQLGFATCAIFCLVCICVFCKLCVLLVVVFDVWFVVCYFVAVLFPFIISFAWLLVASMSYLLS